MSLAFQDRRADARCIKTPLTDSITLGLGLLFLQNLRRTLCSTSTMYQAGVTFNIHVQILGHTPAIKHRSCPLTEM